MSELDPGVLEPEPPLWLSLLMAFVLVAVIGTSIAACISNNTAPPMPTITAKEPAQSAPQLAESYLTCWEGPFGLQCEEALAPHVQMRLRERCHAEGHIGVDPGDRFVCMDGDDSVAWAYSVLDVPDHLASLALVSRRGEIAKP